MRKGFVGMWAVLLLIVAVKVLHIMEPFVVMMAWTVVLAVYLLVKNGLPKLSQAAASLLLGGAVAAACLLHGIGVMGLIFFALPTLICSLAVFSVLDKKGTGIFCGRDAKSVLLSLGIGAAAGVVLTLINTFVFKSDLPADPVLSPVRIIWALQPGIAEEIASRAIFMAMCLYMAGEKMSKAETFTMYAAMILPHAIAHNFGLVECLILAVVFGIPFVLLQRKRDIASAITAHFIIDAVRFVIYGG
ncbi:MAG: hypothetical protein II695_08050 [Oscillospiraceae bacterium]|nr:hypothetical protein [Oscillospiraceae bacterium]